MRIELRSETVGYRACKLFEILCVDIRLNLFDKGNICLVKVYYEILGLIREQVLNYIISGNIYMLGNSYENYDA